MNYLELICSPFCWSQKLLPCWYNHRTSMVIIFSWLGLEPAGREIWNNKSNLIRKKKKQLMPRLEYTFSRWLDPIFPCLPTLDEILHAKSSWQTTGFHSRQDSSVRKYFLQASQRASRSRSLFLSKLTICPFSLQLAVNYWQIYRSCKPATWRGKGISVEWWSNVEGGGIGTRGAGKGRLSFGSRFETK